MPAGCAEPSSEEVVSTAVAASEESDDSSAFTTSFPAAAEKAAPAKNAVERKIVAPTRRTRQRWPLASATGSTAGSGARSHSVARGGAGRSANGAA